MAVYVDKARFNLHGQKYCHMVTDGDPEKLQRKWFQDLRLPHYDLTKNMRALAIQHGAVPVGTKTLVRILRERKRDTSRIGQNRTAVAE
jgi:hypothetical protein